MPIFLGKINYKRSSYKWYGTLTHIYIVPMQLIPTEYLRIHIIGNSFYGVAVFAEINTKFN